MYILPKIPQGWTEHLQDFVNSKAYENIVQTLLKEKEIVYPKSDNVYKALDITALESVKVIIIGQDPYHGDNQATGLSFSVPTQTKIPPSLRNIYKEVERSCDCLMGDCGDLTHWAEQGVLLLNSVLTVKKGSAGSHKNVGWQGFTDFIIQTISTTQSRCVFILWGAYAQSKEHLLDSEKHLILKSVHPSPLSAHRGFIGCNHFSDTNEYLIQHKKSPIKWGCTMSLQF